MQGCGVENSTRDKVQHLIADVEESVSELNLEIMNTQGDGACKKENLKAEGSKMHHGSKVKQQRDRRKLREKRRNTGVIHLASTESTGGSTTGEEDMKEDMSSETKKNTEQNEIIGKKACQLIV